MALLLTPTTLWRRLPIALSLFGALAGTGAPSALAVAPESRAPEGLRHAREARIPAEARAEASLRVAPDGLAYVEGRLLLLWQTSDPLEQGHIRSRYGLTRTRAFPTVNAELVRVESAPDPGRVMEQLQQEPAVRGAEYDGVLMPDLLPDDLTETQWNLLNSGQRNGLLDADVDGPEAWELGTDCTGVVVAVVDTGIALTHPDLASNLWTNPGEIPGNAIDDDHNGFVDDVHGWNFKGNNGEPLDDVDHGSHVSGIIGALGNNRAQTETQLGQTGMVGVCWRAELMAVKALGKHFGATSDVVGSIEYAIQNGADLINASLSGYRYSQLLKDIIEVASDAGILVVVSAGNDGWNIDQRPVYPASLELPNLVTVAATNRQDVLAPFSNYGPIHVDLAAPGMDIYSTLASVPYGLMDGTSMSAPHVTGAAALLLSRAPGLTMEGLQEALYTAADRPSSLDGQVSTGGRLNLFRALDAAQAIENGQPSPYVP